MDQITFESIENDLLEHYLLVAMQTMDKNKRKIDQTEDLPKMFEENLKRQRTMKDEEKAQCNICGKKVYDICNHNFHSHRRKNIGSSVQLKI